MMPENNYMQLLEKFSATMKDASADTTKGEYMTDDTTVVINFDCLKDDYVKSLKLSEIPTSCDALYLHSDETFYLIEFKNGIIDEKKCYKIKMKILDSLLIWLDLTDSTISSSRENISYILVYNEDCLHTSRQYQQHEECITATSQNPNHNDANHTPPSLTYLSKTIAKKAKQHFIQFGLSRYKAIYFKEVYTYTKKEFHDYFIATC